MTYDMPIIYSRDFKKQYKKLSAYEKKQTVTKLELLPLIHHCGQIV